MDAIVDKPKLKKWLKEEKILSHEECK